MKHKPEKIHDTYLSLKLPKVMLDELQKIIETRLDHPTRASVVREALADYIKAHRKLETSQ